MGYVYIYLDKEKQCKYVGQSINWEHRFQQHCRTDMKDKYKLIDSIIVFRCSDNKMNDLENYLIYKLSPEWNKTYPVSIPNINLSKYKKFIADPKRHLSRGQL